MSERDPLSEVLRSVRLSGAIFLDAELSAPWGFASPAASDGAGLIARENAAAFTSHYRE